MFSPMGFCFELDSDCLGLPSLSWVCLPLPGCVVLPTLRHKSADWPECSVLLLWPRPKPALSSGTPGSPFWGLVPQTISSSASTGKSRLRVPKLPHSQTKQIMDRSYCKRRQLQPQLFQKSPHFSGHVDVSLPKLPLALAAGAAQSGLSCLLPSKPCQLSCVRSSCFPCSYLLLEAWTNDSPLLLYLSLACGHVDAQWVFGWLLFGWMGEWMEGWMYV